MRFSALITSRVGNEAVLLTQWLVLRQSPLWWMMGCAQRRRSQPAFIMIMIMKLVSVQDRIRFEMAIHISGWARVVHEEYFFSPKL
jgi:hypothetical protein